MKKSEVNATTGTVKETKSKEAKTMKKEVKVVEEKKEVVNAEKTNISWDGINELWASFGIVPYNPNTKGYRVMGKSKGGTSLHITQKDGYILLSTQVDFDAATKSKIDGVEYIEDGNSVDTVRPHKVIAKTMEQFKELLKIYATNPFNQIPATK